MCGRFVAHSPSDQIAAYFGADLPVETLGENYNVTPTQDIYGVVAPRGENVQSAPQLEAFHWGLIPNWAKDRKIGSRMTNARSETLAEKPAFKGTLPKKRLLIPMDGFYEWKIGAAGGHSPSRGNPPNSRISSIALTASPWQPQDCGPHGKIGTSRSITMPRRSGSTVPR